MQNDEAEYYLATQVAMEAIVKALAESGAEGAVRITALMAAAASILDEDMQAYSPLDRGNLFMECAAMQADGMWSPANDQS